MSNLFTDDFLVLGQKCRIVCVIGSVSVFNELCVFGHFTLGEVLYCVSYPG